MYTPTISNMITTTAIRTPNTTAVVLEATTAGDGPVWVCGCVCVGVCVCGGGCVGVVGRMEGGEHLI